MAERALDLDLVGKVVDRIRAEITKKEESVLPIAMPALQLGDSTPPRLPAALVFLSADDATESVAPTAGAFQRVTATLAVVHVIDAANTKGNRGGATVDPLADLVGRTRAVLNGWRPPDRPVVRDTLALRRGRLIAIEDGRALWQDEYSISWRAARVQQQET